MRLPQARNAREEAVLRTVRTGARRYRELRGLPAARAATRAHGPQVVEVAPQAYRALVRRLAADCESVLDVGTGLMDSLVGSPCRVKLGLDAHRPYLERRRDRHAIPIHADALQLADLFVSGAVDLVTMMDVIEHLPKEDALELLRQAESVARRRTLLATPRGEFPQEKHDAFELGGEVLQQHRSTWDVEDLTALGYRVAIVKGLHGPENVSFVQAFGPDAPAVDGLVAWKDLR